MSHVHGREAVIKAGWSVGSFLGSLLRLGVVIGLLILVLWRTELRELTTRIDRQLLVAMAAAQLPLFAGLGFQAWRLSLLTNRPRAPLWTAFKAVTLAAGLNSLLPGRLSELVKVAYLRDKVEMGLSIGIAATVLERLCDVIILGILSLLSVFLFLSPGNPMALVLVGSVALAGALLLPRLEPLLTGWLARLRWAPLRQLSTHLVEHASKRVREGDTYRAFVIGIGAWGCSFLAVTLFLHHASTSPVGLRGALAVFVASTLGGSVAALPGGIGTYEAAAVLCLTGLGLVREEALVLALGLHVAQLGGSLMASGAILLCEPTGMADLLREVREITRA